MHDLEHVPIGGADDVAEADLGHSPGSHRESPGCQNWPTVAVYDPDDSDDPDVSDSSCAPRVSCTKTCGERDLQESIDAWYDNRLEGALDDRDDDGCCVCANGEVRYWDATQSLMVRVLRRSSRQRSNRPLPLAQNLSILDFRLTEMPLVHQYQTNFLRQMGGFARTLNDLS